jgi:hypothetical protein
VGGGRISFRWQNLHVPIMRPINVNGCPISLLRQEERWGVVSFAFHVAEFITPK